MIEVLLAYGTSYQVSKAFNVVLRVRYRDTPPRVIRGTTVSINWWNSDAELQKAYTAALDEALDRLPATVDLYCRSG